MEEYEVIRIPVSDGTDTVLTIIIFIVKNTAWKNT